MSPSHHFGLNDVGQCKVSKKCWISMCRDRGPLLIHRTSPDQEMALKLHAQSCFRRQWYFLRATKGSALGLYGTKLASWQSDEGLTLPNCFFKHWQRFYELHTCRSPCTCERTESLSSMCQNDAISGLFHLPPTDLPRFRWNAWPENPNTFGSSDWL